MITVRAITVKELELPDSDELKLVRFEVSKQILEAK